MVDSEDITLEKIKTQELSLEINTLSNAFQQNATIQDTSSEPPLTHAVDPNNKSKPLFKKYCSFCHKKITLFQRVFADLKTQNHNLDLQLLPFINILKILLLNPITLVTVVEVIVTLLADLLAKRDTNLVHIPVRIHVPDIILKPPHAHIRLIITVIDLDMINTTTKIPIDHTILHELFTTLILLVVLQNITLVLVNVLQIFLLSIDTIPLIAPLLNHAMIVIEADPTQIQIIILNINTNHPLILPIHLHHPFKTTPLQKLTLK